MTNLKSIQLRRLKLSPRSQMFILIIFITITQQPEQDRWAENQPTAGLSSLNEYEYENENGMRRSRTKLLVLVATFGHRDLSSRYLVRLSIAT